MCPYLHLKLEEKFAFFFDFFSFGFIQFNILFFFLDFDVRTIVRLLFLYLVVIAKEL